MMIMIVQAASLIWQYLYLQFCNTHTVKEQEMRYERYNQPASDLAR